MWPEWSGVTRRVGLGQPRGGAIDVPRRHAGRLEVACDAAPSAFHVLEHAEDAFRRAAKLLAKRVALFGLGLADPHLVLLRKLTVGLPVVGGDMLGRYTGKRQQHRRDEPRPVLAGEAAKRHATVSLSHPGGNARKAL